MLSVEMDEQIALICKAKRQYMLTCKVSIYWLLTFHGTVLQNNQFIYVDVSVSLGPFEVSLR